MTSDNVHHVQTIGNLDNVSIEIQLRLLLYNIVQ